MTLHDTTPEVARRLRAGLNGDPDQRAATTLLIDAANGVWLTKLSGWPEYLCTTEDTRRPGGLWIDWQQLRDDLATDDMAWAQFNDWTASYTGRVASEDTYEQTREQMVPRRPWHGASGSELVVLRIAVELAPGGLFGDGIPRLDPANKAAVAAAVDTLVEGQYLTDQ
ncbi:MAG: hypothetical protein MUF09_09375 [Candidatus Nanopelagicales bacterium]|jgi:hypothetical protein|nr:hypothetical protein [Candidatus Nanopelagicales bacterium]